MSLTVTPVSGEELRSALPDLARLRTEVFREFPYLYSGTPAYEERYLQTYLEAPGALVVLVRDGSEVVGASTALPLAAETEALQRPFRGSELDPGEVLYLGESVLRAAYRGRGLGHRFFDEREAHARRLGLSVTAFCAVQRPANHPARPADYRPLNAFWEGRGYVERPDLETTLSWPDVGETQETPKPMRFWVKRLD
ncbi:acetyltransferase [Deinococcus sp. RL]|uniref:GNAT family N-acetyltransferase n=1 Tax=Deinococcus sp. RL TaxID=1489678 RepID=UPI0004D4568D|nr:GNAT family N-acetyltransferase [Deinococcus sp. RL]KEF34083.1 acetyltransferase [Deinococcus sp. RL]